LTLAHSELLPALGAVEGWGSAHDWTGSDPYDGLNATRIVTPLLRSRRGRQVVTQVVKRSPLDLRPLLGVRPAQSAAALAQIVSAYAIGSFPVEHERYAKLARLVRVLEAQRCEAFAEPCWGYHFDVQTRVFFYPKGSPNTIATAFAGLALLDAFEATGDPTLLELAAGAGDFFLHRVPQTEAPRGAYFGYLAEDRTPIHNANMLVCALLARLARHTGRTDMRDAADAGIAYTVTKQRPDGSWPYGEEPHLSWVDGFHTGYVLEALLVCVEAGRPGVDALERGLAYYRDELFLGDGTPKYFPSSTYPVDSQCIAQGIQTFARAAGSRPEFAETAWLVFAYALQKMRRHDGAFGFQRRRLWRNRTPHVRWSEAPMLLALTHLAELEEQSG
jgi:hypothetical protein